MNVITKADAHSPFSFFHKENREAAKFAKNKSEEQIHGLNVVGQLRSWENLISTRNSFSTSST